MEMQVRCRRRKRRLVDDGVTPRGLMQGWRRHCGGNTRAANSVTDRGAQAAFLAKNSFTFSSASLRFFTTFSSPAQARPGGTALPT